MRPLRWTLCVALLALTGALSAQQEPMQPLSEEAMADTRINEPMAAEDRDEISKDEIEELQQYLRDQQLEEQGITPPRQRRQERQQGLTPFQRNFRDALMRATRENRPPQ